MSYRRSDQISEELVRLHHLLESLDGSRSMGAVSPGMEKEADEVRGKMNLLYDEQVEIQMGLRPDRRQAQACS